MKVFSPHYQTVGKYRMVDVCSHCFSESRFDPCTKCNLLIERYEKTYSDKTKLMDIVKNYEKLLYLIKESETQTGISAYTFNSNIRIL